jgi:ankyrin repeat protein
MFMRSARAAVSAVAVAVTAVTLTAQLPSTQPADPFYTAIRSGDTAQVKALLDGGADVNTKERRGGATPLMHAAAVGSLETTTFLLDKGADVNTRNSGGATALMWAATDLAKVRLLVDRGADVNVVANGGRTALFLAAMSNGSAEIVKLLLAKGANARAVDSLKMTALTAATLGDDAGTIRQLIDAGVDVNASDTHGTTPLMNAAMSGNLEAVKLLLAKGANVNTVSGPPYEPVKNGTIALGQFTALSLAATGPADVVKALIDAGADVNVKEFRGMTPLMFAAVTDHGDLETLKTLIGRGADLAAKSVDGETALDWALKSGSTPVVAALKAAKAPAGRSAMAAMAAHDIPSPAPAMQRQAVERGVALLERASGTFFVNGACGACHAQNVTDVATMAARTHGVRISDEGAAQRAYGAAAAFAAIAPRLLEREDTPVVDIPLYTLAGFAAAKYPADRSTDVLVLNVVAQQHVDGHWHVGGIARPPIEDGDFSRTALAVRALREYAPPGRGAEMRERAAKAVAWLRSSKPRTAEDRSFRLAGLKWGGADAPVIRQAARDLAASQRADGGWAQREEMASDAYATGLVLYALIESGSVAPADAAVHRGTAYLLSTQRADGSWFVRSRSPKFQPYFDGGFPYEHDQWISSMATGWATAALATSLGEGKTRLSVQ